jgi:hypothetical protein
MIDIIKDNYGLIHVDKLLLDNDKISLNEKLHFSEF